MYQILYEKLKELSREGKIAYLKEIHSGGSRLE